MKRLNCEQCIIDGKYMNDACVCVAKKREPPIYVRHGKYNVYCPIDYYQKIMIACCLSIVMKHER